MKTLREKFDERFFNYPDSATISMFTLREFCNLIDAVLTGETAGKAEEKPRDYVLDRMADEWGLCRKCGKPSNPPESAEVEFDQEAVCAKWRELNPGSAYQYNGWGNAVRLVEWALTTFKAPQREIPSDDELIKFWREWPKRQPMPNPPDDGPTEAEYAVMYLQDALRAFPVPAEQPPKVEASAVLHAALDEARTALDFIAEYTSDKRRLDELKNACSQASELSISARDQADKVLAEYDDSPSAPPPAPAYDEAGEFAKGWSAELLFQETWNRNISLEDFKERLPRAKLGCAQNDAELERHLRKVLDHYDRNTCTHDQTRRGGAIWTICDDCEMKWADDQGGFKPHVDAPDIAAARKALSAYEAGKAS